MLWPKFLDPWSCPVWNEICNQKTPWSSTSELCDSPWAILGQGIKAVAENKPVLFVLESKQDRNGLNWMEVSTLTFLSE